MVNPMRRFLVAASLLVTSVLFGCATQKVPPASYFDLVPVAMPAAESVQKAKSAATPKLIVVQDLRLPQYLDRPQIVYRTGGNALAWSDERRWAEPLRSEMQRLLAVNLGRLLPDTSVVMPPFAVGSQAALRVEVEIRSFERSNAGKIVIDAQWWASGSGGISSIPASTVLHVGEVVVDAADGNALTAAMSDVFAEFCRVIANRVRAAGNSAQ